ncbi:hypothetical protein D3C72_764510 [compost metagenome]
MCGDLLDVFVKCKACIDLKTHRNIVHKSPEHLFQIRMLPAGNQSAHDHILLPRIGMQKYRIYR